MIDGYDIAIVLNDLYHAKGPKTILARYGDTLEFLERLGLVKGRHIHTPIYGYKYELTEAGTHAATSYLAPFLDAALVVYKGEIR